MNKWLDKYEDGGYLGTTNVGRDYSPAWGGQFQDGGKKYLLNPNAPTVFNAERLKEKKKVPYEPSSAVKNTKAALAVGSLAPNPIVSLGSALAGSVYDFGTATKYYLDDQKEKAKEDFVQGVLGLLPTRFLKGYGLKGDAIYKNLKGVKLAKIASDAKTVTEGDYESTPFLSFAMGGSLPGSVGFTYARTGSIPSEGPYAKKTLPSAQNGKKQGNPISDWWYNLDDVQSTYKMYNDLDPFLKNWYQNPETQRRLKQNLQDSLIHRNTNPNQLISKAINTLQNTPVFSRELVKKADVSASDLEYNNELQGWKSPSTFGGNPYFDSHNYMAGTSELGSYDPNTKQIIVNSFNLPGTIAHEGVHGAPALQDAMEDVIDWKYFNKKDSKARFVEQMGISNYNPKTNKFTEETFEEIYKRVPKLYDNVWKEREKYLDKDGMYPRIMDIRRTLNLKPGQKVDKSILQNESIRRPLSDLNHYYDNDTIIEMLNTLAKNNSKQEIASAQNGKEMKYYQEGLDFQPRTISRKGSVIKDNRGQWAHPGEITQIDSNDITMQGVPYPVLGIGADGQRIMMEPGEDYRFNKGPVTEFPMAKGGMSVNNVDAQPLKKLDQLLNFTNYNKPTKGGWLDKYN